MDNSLTVAEAARDLPELVRRAHQCSEVTILIEDGRPVARIVPIANRPKTCRELAEAVGDPARPRLGVEEAAAFEADVLAGSSVLREPKPPTWD